MIEELLENPEHIETYCVGTFSKEILKVYEMKDYMVKAFNSGNKEN